MDPGVTVAKAWEGRHRVVLSARGRSSGPLGPDASSIVSACSASVAPRHCVGGQVEFPVDGQFRNHGK